MVQIGLLQPSPFLHPLLPEGLVTAQCACVVEAPYAEEQAAMAKAARARRLSYGAGRHCARAVLRALECADRPLLADADGAPTWPPGIRGSIAHTGRWAVAAAAPAGMAAGLGIDIEDGQVPASLWPMLFGAEEREALQGDTRGVLARILFSAKETFFKAQWPLTRRRPAWRDIRCDAADGDFTIEPPPDLAALLPARLGGRYAVAADGVASALVIS